MRRRRWLALANPKQLAFRQNMTKVMLDRLDTLLEMAGIRPIVLAEVDDMAMLRLLARECEGVTMVPPIVVRDELEGGILVEHCRIPEVTESFYAIVKKRRFPNRILNDVLKFASAS